MEVQNRARLAIMTLAMAAAPLATLQAREAAQAAPQGQSTAGTQQAQTQQTAEQNKFTLEGDTALWTVAIRPDKTAEFEQVLKRLHEALLKSEQPERRRQAEGWTVVRLGMALPDGTIPYVHVVHPVVPGADYAVMQILYDEFPDERQALYELYRGAFAKNVSLATGAMVLDMSGQAAQTAQTAAPLVIESR